MAYRLGPDFGQFNTLKQFLTDIPGFFERNQEGHDALVDFLSFIFRVSIVISCIVRSLMRWSVEWFYGLVMGVIIVWLIAPFLARFCLWLGSLVLNFLTKVIAQTEDSMAAERVVAYCSVGLLIPSVWKLVMLPSLVCFIFATIGILKQYKTTPGKAIIIAAIPFFAITWIWILIGMVAIILFGLAMMSSGFM